MGVKFTESGMKQRDVKELASHFFFFSVSWLTNLIANWSAVAMWNNDCFWCGCECSTWSEELGSCRHQSVSTQQAQVEQTERERVSHSVCCLPERGKKKNHYQWFSRMTPLWQILSWNPPRAPGPLPSPQLLQFISLLLHTKVCWLLPPLIISWFVRIPIRGQQTINNQAASATLSTSSHTWACHYL